MVTDTAGFIGNIIKQWTWFWNNLILFIYLGTSNWSEDYFTTTAGVSFVFEPIRKVHEHSQIDLRQQLEDVFHRDFYSDLSQSMRSWPLFDSLKLYANAMK